MPPKQPLIALLNDKDKWPFVTLNRHVLVELERRIVEAARRQPGKGIRRDVSYTDWFQGIKFNRVPNDPNPREVGNPLWRGENETIVLEFLSYISLKSYVERDFLSTSLVVRKREQSPGNGFYGLAEEYGFIPKGSSQADREQFWRQQQQEALAKL